MAAGYGMSPTFNKEMLSNLIDGVISMDIEHDQKMAVLEGIQEACKVGMVCIGYPNGECMCVDEKTSETDGQEAVTDALGSDYIPDEESSKGSAVSPVLDDIIKTLTEIRESIKDDKDYGRVYASRVTRIADLVDILKESTDAKNEDGNVDGADDELAVLEDGGDVGGDVAEGSDECSVADSAESGPEV